MKIFFSLIIGLGLVSSVFAATVISSDDLDAAVNAADSALSTFGNTNYEETQTAISFLHEYEITKFDSYETFMPTKNIRRDEVAKMLLTRYDKVLSLQDGVTKLTETTVCKPSDLAAAYPDLKIHLTRACGFGVMKGSNNKLSPKNTVTNGQIITIIIRMLDGVQSEKNVKHFSDNYVKIANDYALLEGLSVTGKYIDAAATRGNVALMLYRASKLD